MSENNRKLFRSPEAQEDLLSVWQFGADEWSPSQADEHLRNIEDMCDRLRVHSELGRKRNELIAGLYSIPVSPHIVFYQQSPKPSPSCAYCMRRSTYRNIFAISAAIRAGVLSQHSAVRSEAVSPEFDPPPADEFAVQSRAGHENVPGFRLIFLSPLLFATRDKRDKVILHNH